LVITYNADIPHRAVDIWAVGCLITEMLTGDPLFPGDSDIDQLYHIIKCFGESFHRSVDLKTFSECNNTSIVDVRM